MTREYRLAKDLFPTAVDRLGPPRYESPLRGREFEDDERRVLYHAFLDDVAPVILQKGEPLAFEVAGPRRHIFFDPASTTVALLTAGGLCPGLNDVIRAVVHELHFSYKVNRILGVRFGFAGLNPVEGWPMLELTPASVRHIHEQGGTILGVSRGPQPIEAMIDTLVREKIDALIAIGGDGTLHGALDLYREIKKRGLPIAVVGVPKTIDNDIDLVPRTFGFDTAVSEATRAIRSAHTEAESTVNGLGLVKLMGRESGFIAAHAALAEGNANYVLVPEVRFELEGPQGLLPSLEQRMHQRQHALVVVAEGAGQHLFEGSFGTDASGNRILGDIGQFLKKAIADHFKKINLGVSIKYIDPSYQIRSVPANANDSVFCLFLGQMAAHAVMSGKTGLLVGSWRERYVHIPLEAAVARRKKIDTRGALWRSVLAATGQPNWPTAENAG